MSTNENTIYLEEAQAEFGTAISRRNWTLAHAVADRVQADGFEVESMELRRQLNQAQAKEGARISNMLEDEVAGHEDPRDISDRDYPRE